MAQVSPTKSKLIETKRALALAREGYVLLDKKRNVLIRELMKLIDKARDVQSRTEALFKEAYEALMEANLYFGIENVQEIGLGVEEFRSLEIRLRSVMGVEVPEVGNIEPEFNPAYGYAMTNAKLDVARKKFMEVLALSAKLAEVETGVYRLAVEIKRTQRRVNSLEYVLIPKYKETVKFIESYLEETERDDFFRMKRLKSRRES
ncbi:MAG: V-type ATP synthase subunit D [Mesoaciditoga sp.]|mgnify:CR=1 FL=1|uniref:V-type ATP synthase subunit D n=1 Tax=Athalassotoga sp. TaxID=2022597 RepID=UPI000CCB55E9|nr:MAG: V-type ATP synthase subunit D [Mesoaciditoga sp.]PMP80806.1 MAG: V-type ATP synthase subunit D [Mesoaciditoga sp.]HEU23882.1 V-type ATP synthase subunit D [Mesoaciditoga lauensis]